MRHVIEALESRRLLSGGVDASFGGAAGVVFDDPGDRPIISTIAVDSGGRLLVGGVSPGDAGASTPAQLYFTRMRADGYPDPHVADGGVIVGTPRGLSRADFIVPLPSGGCIVAQGGFEQVSLIRLTPRGRVDSTFGKNGVTRLGINAHDVLLQPDGKLLVVGYAPKRNPDLDAGRYNHAVRLHADGRLDRSYGDNGWATLGVEGEGDLFFFLTADITSALLDREGRLVVAVELTDVSRDDFTDFTGGTVQLFLERFNTDGSRDTTFGQTDNAIFEKAAIVFSAAMTDSSNPSERGTALLRSDGRIVVVHQRDDTTQEQPVFASLVDATGAVSPTTAAIGTLAPTFHPNLAATMLADDSIVLAGRRTSGPTDVPALLHLQGDLTLDNTFGTSGILTLPNANGQTQARLVRSDPDGTVTALCDAVGQSTTTAPTPPLAVRVFTDDRPIVTLGRVRTDANNVRVNAWMRGVRPIDTTSLDDNDLRLVDSQGIRMKLRLVGLVSEPDGAVIATYRVSRGLLAAGPEIFSVHTNFQQVLDDHGDGNGSGDIGEISL